MPRFFRDPAKVETLKVSLLSFLKSNDDRPRYVGEISLALKISLSETDELVDELGGLVRRVHVGEDMRGSAVTLARG